MNHLPKIIALVLMVGCSTTPDNEAKDHRANVKDLQATYATKFSTAKSLLEPETGWPSTIGCDGLLWAGKASAIGLPSEVYLAEHNPGEWGRRPVVPHGHCWPNDANGDGEPDSRSTISNDMFTGLLWALWRDDSIESVAALKRLEDYREENRYVMGEPFDTQPTTVALSYNLSSVLARMLCHKTDGETCPQNSKNIPVFGPPFEDYAFHIQVLGILLQGEVYESQRTESMTLIDVSDSMRTWLNNAARVYPNNPLFLAAKGTYDGNMEPAIIALQDDDNSPPSYVRGENQEALALIEWLFAADIVLRRAGVVVVGTQP